MPCFIYENLRLKFFGISGRNQIFTDVPLSNDDCQTEFENATQNIWMFYPETATVVLTFGVAFQSHTARFSCNAWSVKKLGSTFWFEVSAWELKTALDCTFSLKYLLHRSFPASRLLCLGSEHNLFSSPLLWGLIDSCLGSRLGGCTLLLSGNMTPRWQMLREVLTHYFEDNERKKMLPPTIPWRERFLDALLPRLQEIIWYFVLALPC